MGSFLVLGSGERKVLQSAAEATAAGSGVAGEEIRCCLCRGTRPPTAVEEFVGACVGRVMCVWCHVAVFRALKEADAEEAELAREVAERGASPEPNVPERFSPLVVAPESPSVVHERGDDGEGSEEAEHEIAVVGCLHEDHDRNVCGDPCWPHQLCHYHRRHP
jgi:hypothetical protein